VSQAQPTALSPRPAQANSPGRAPGPSLQPRRQTVNMLWPALRPARPGTAVRPTRASAAGRAWPASGL